MPEQIYFVSGSDTDIGKTWVCRSLARALLARGHRLTVVKPIQTGSERDADWVVRGLHGDVAARTIIHLEAPMAPLAAAKRTGSCIDLEKLIDECGALGSGRTLLIEGAGGIAVPLDQDGRDWADFARALEVSHPILVIENRLGAINQARLTASHARSRQLTPRWWLNRIGEVDAMHLESNREALSNDPLAELVALQEPNAEEPEWLDASWL